MSKTRINIKDNKHDSDTLAIQTQLQVMQAPANKVEIEQDASEGMARMCEYRYEEIQRIEEDAIHIKQMFQDFAYIVNEQQPLIESVASTLKSAERHVIKAEENLVEADQGRKCLIS